MGRGRCVPRVPVRPRRGNVLSEIVRADTPVKDGLVHSGGVVYSPRGENTSRTRRGDSVREIGAKPVAPLTCRRRALNPIDRVSIGTSAVQSAHALAKATLVR